MKISIILVTRLLGHLVLGSELIPLRLHCGPGVDLVSKRNLVPRIFLGW